MTTDHGMRAARRAAGLARAALRAALAGSGDAAARRDAEAVTGFGDADAVASRYGPTEVPTIEVSLALIAYGAARRAMGRASARRRAAGDLLRGALAERRFFRREAGAAGAVPADRTTCLRLAAHWAGVARRTRAGAP